MENNIELCRTCKYFAIDPRIAAQNVASRAGICRRFPPTVHIRPAPGGAVGINTMYPPVQSDTWCGEWQPNFAVSSHVQN